MALHLLRLVNHWFAIAAFWGYLAAFALAFTMVIVFFPVGALLLLFVAIFSLPIVVVVSLTLSAWERAWCRRWLRSARCPTCQHTESVERLVTVRAGDGASGGASDRTGDADAAADAQMRNPEDPPCYECRRCGAFFSASGEGVESPVAVAAATA